MALPHICFDATCVVPNGKGATIYALSLLRALQQLNPPAQFTVLMRQEAVAQLTNSPQNWTIQGVSVKSAHLWHLVTLPHLLRSLKPDLLHLLGEVALGRLPVPYVLTIHELPHLYRQKTHHAATSAYAYLSQKVIETTLPAACRRAVHLLAVSQSTATDLSKAFRIPPERISVTYEAAAAQFFAAADQPLSEWLQTIPHPYLLIFATGDRREVPEQVVQAFGAIANRIPHGLVIAGRCPSWQKQQLTELATQLNCLERLHFTGFVPDADLPILYRDAEVFIEISRYEGFGLQVCEAMATGTVTIASEVSSLPEVIGNAGYLVPLEENATLADTLWSILNSPIEAQKLAHLARQRATQFSWQTCAQETWHVLESVLSQSKPIT